MNDPTITRTAPTKVRRIADIDTALLRTFKAVVELGSLERASESVFRTQAAVSQQIKRLEQTLDVKLFEKAGRRLQLTETGQYVYRKAEMLLAMADSLLDSPVSSGLKDDLRAPYTDFLGEHLTSDWAMGPSSLPDNATVSIINGLGPLPTIQPVRKFEDYLLPKHKELLQFWKEMKQSSEPLTLDLLANRGLFNIHEESGGVAVMQGTVPKMIDVTDFDMDDLSIGRDELPSSLDRFAKDKEFERVMNEIPLAAVTSGCPALVAGNSNILESKFLAEDVTRRWRRLDRLFLPISCGVVSGKVPARTQGVMILILPRDNSYYALADSGSVDSQELANIPMVLEPPVLGY